MAWFSGKVALGNLDLAGAVSKLSESVKNIEKNFDTALGFEEVPPESSTTEALPASGLWPSNPDRKTLLDPVMAFMGHEENESAEESTEKTETLHSPSSVEEKEVVTIDTDKSMSSATDNFIFTTEHEGEKSSPMLSDAIEGTDVAIDEGTKAVVEDSVKYGSTESNGSESDSQPVHVELSAPTADHNVEPEPLNNFNQKESSEIRPSESSEVVETKVESSEVDYDVNSPQKQAEPHSFPNFEETTVEEKNLEEETKEIVSPVISGDEVSATEAEVEIEPSSSISASPRKSEIGEEYSDNLPSVRPLIEVVQAVSPGKDAIVREVVLSQQVRGCEPDHKEQRLSSGSNASEVGDSVIEMEKLKKEMKMMETALQGAARQAQAKADEIAKLMNENEQLKSVIEDLRGKTNEAEVELIREEYHQRVATLERKVYALAKERDTLRREQNKKSDATALLKEKDEIINQVMAEGEALSKKQAAQEAQMRKLRAQIRELEEEKKGLGTKLQVEENKVDSMKRDKAATENLLQETIEKHQGELAAQKEFYTNALNAAKEAEALAEARANNEARAEIESRLREAEEREAMLVQALEELRQTLSRKEQQAVFREDMLRRDVEDLQKRYQASERRCEELVTQVPESTRPLLRQIEAMQETTARRAEAWAAVERSLNSRLQEAEAKAAAAEERERSINERLSQTLSRINVLEAQISCLRAEQTQLSRSLEKERQRAAENRQEYLAAKEDADTHEGRVSQLEEEIRELRRKHKEELHEAILHRELLQQEIDKEKAARLDLERAARLQPPTIADQSSLVKHKSGIENGHLPRKLSSTSSLGSMEESFFLQASLDSSDNFSERRNTGEPPMSPYYMKSMTSSSFEALLRQKEGELASYMSRLASLESIRDSLADELVKMTEQCEKLKTEAAVLPGIKAELEALRRRHSAALELMGERDEELEELRADIVDLKEMYREQVNMLVNKINIMSSS